MSTVRHPAGDLKPHPFTTLPPIESEEAPNHNYASVRGCLATYLLSEELHQWTYFFLARSLLHPLLIHRELLLPPHRTASTHLATHRKDAINRLSTVPASFRLFPGRTRGAGMQVSVGRKTLVTSARLNVLRE